MCPGKQPGKGTPPHTLTQAGHKLGGATSGKTFPVIREGRAFSGIRHLISAAGPSL